MPHSRLSPPRNVICAFYASTNYGSEYRAGMEFIRFAANEGFDLAIIADLDQNSSPAEIEAIAPGMQVMHIPSPIKRQKTLYRFSDLIAQTIWHLRVARWLRKQKHIENLWVQNGASPWLPLVPYFSVSPTLIWGPVGGGEPPPPAMMQMLSVGSRLREGMRSAFEKSLLKSKFTAMQRNAAPRVIALARTSEAQIQLQKGQQSNIPLIPEILDPLNPVRITRKVMSNPRIVWVGQDIPRKNLRLGLDIFETLRAGAFPNATLDVFGCEPNEKMSAEGVTFHGWVNKINWNLWKDDGVLLLTSFREGLPSVVLEALQNGLLCVSSDVGAIASLRVPSLVILPRAEYPNYSKRTIQEVADRIRQHLETTEIEITSISYRANLSQYLNAEGFKP